MATPAALIASTKEAINYDIARGWERKFAQVEAIRAARPPMVALTFDDGPSAHTSQILDILEYHNARATFFVIGRSVKYYADTVLRAHELGNEIASHMYTHQLLTRLSDERIRQGIAAGSNAIAAVIGYSPTILRPPGGAINDRVVYLIRQAGYAIILWNIDTNDWRDRNADIIYRRVMQNIRDGDIILLHDIYRTTVQAMERVIPSLIEQGFYLVTVSELLYYVHGRPPVPGEVYFHGREVNGR